MTVHTRVYSVSGPLLTSKWQQKRVINTNSSSVDRTLFFLRQYKPTEQSVSVQINNDDDAWIVWTLEMSLSLSAHAQTAHSSTTVPDIYYSDHSVTL